MKLHLSLQWRIALAYTALILVSMGAVSIYLITFISHTYVSNLEASLEHQARLVGEASSPYLKNHADVSSLQAVAQRIGTAINTRVSIIDANGTVNADSWEDPASMGNQLGQMEIKGALESGVGRDTRVSATLQKELMYIAVPIKTDGELLGLARVAVPTSEVQGNVNRIITTVALSGTLVTILAILLGIYLARRTSRSLRSVKAGARRLAKGDLDQRVHALSQDETKELADAFNAMAASLKGKIQELSQERNMLSGVLESMADGVLVISPEGKVRLFNQAARTLLEIPKDSLEGRFMEKVRDHDLQELVEKVSKTRKSEGAEIERPHRHQFLSVVAIPLDETSEPPAVLMTIHDLTRIRQIETTRKEFVSNVSHELRTPLASIKAAVETLEDGALKKPETAAMFIERIRKDVERMIVMVSDLLELARVESGQSPIHTYAIELEPLVNDAVEQMRARADSKGISISVDMPKDVPSVIANGEKLNQILTNLLDNAIKFTPGPGKVAVSARSSDDFVEVQVSDTGVGISKEHMPHIFERFYKVDRSRRDGGTGLGLAIVKHIVQAFGGQVWVKSEGGRGSTFGFTLPKVKQK